MIAQVSRWIPGRQVVVVADGTYAVLDFLRKVSHLPNVCLITRLRLDACLYDPAPPREAHTKGRTALKGKRQPKLAERLHDPDTNWQKQTLSWYGGTTGEMEIATGTALWYQSPVPPVAIRWVLIRDPAGQYGPLALLCTDQNAEAAQMVQWFVLCWTVEVTFHEVRAHLGVETQRQWSDLAIVRTTPALLGLFSLVTIFAQQLLGKAGLARMPFHSLRHSTASLLLSIGVHPKIVQELLGHSNISMTLDTYSHVISVLHAEAATQLNTLLTKRKTPVAVNQG